MEDLRVVRIERDEDGVRRLTLDRPPVNALGRDLVEDLERALRALASDDDARCLIVRSAGAHFCAGADLKERRDMPVDEVRRFVPRLAGVCNLLAAVPYPTIAAIRGGAIGGGCELALAADLRILAASATIGLRETALAILPGAGGTQRLPRLIGPSRAKRWIFAAEVHSAETAARDGVADRVVDDERLDEAASELARTIAAGGPRAVRLAKRAIDEGASMSLDEALAFEWDCYQHTLGTEDRLEALRAYHEKRPPRFQGR